MTEKRGRQCRLDGYYSYNDIQESMQEMSDYLQLSKITKKYALKQKSYVMVASGKEEKAHNHSHNFSA